jgi:adenosylcobinamide kinase/adenosylcobinamide-phosphate guanylyltransferase
MSLPKTALPRSLLVLGGARSGKSRYGQSRAEASCLAPLLIATAEAGDEEMRARIERHRAERGARWALAEAPIALIEELGRQARPGRIAVVDCLTLWLSNLMLAGHDEAAAGDRLRDTIAGLPCPVIFISNEVGSGIVPANALARAFADAQGRLNQKIAGAVDEVVLIVAGQALLIKPAAQPGAVWTRGP